MTSLLTPGGPGLRHVLAILCCLTLLSGTAGALPLIPATDCLLIEQQQAPTIDGVLDDPVWAEATETTTFWGLWGEAAHSQGRMRFAGDEQWVYVAFIASETDMQADHTEVAEIFLVPDLAREPIAELVVRLDGGKIKNREVINFELADADWRAAYRVYDDHYDFADWDLSTHSRCFVHLTNSMNWQQVTGQQLPTEPPTAETYSQAGVPWFDHYREQPVVAGSSVLRGLKSVVTLDKEKGGQAVPENDSVVIDKVIQLREPLATGQVREGKF